ncbi:MAG: hypothetical protein NUV65_00140 [Candidatus Roizmanbacteria bacterium]|nr:hypothetical protein [Candidatus Roizmanbacteria bacterium]
MAFARLLRKGAVKKETEKQQDKFVLILDNVYDTFNVGGMYRIADASGIQKIYHCGDTPIPIENEVVNNKIARASVGLYQYIAWEHHDKTEQLVDTLKQHGYTIIALEQDTRSIPFDQCSVINTPIALIAGNETFGVDKQVIDKADVVLELPMFGINKSVNVVVATGIVAYHLRTQLQKSEKCKTQSYRLKT